MSPLHDVPVASALTGVLLVAALGSCRPTPPMAQEFVAESSTTGLGGGTTGATDPDSSDGEGSGTQCGNGVLDEGEQCDPGTQTASCDADCTVAECGDGVTNEAANEQCDDQGASPTCDVDCTVAECLDGVLNELAGEVCDEGGQSASCDIDCTPAECGDGVFNQQTGEECDEGGNTATCDADCTLVDCGDGVYNPEAEACDSGGESATCNSNCTPAVCGDGITNITAAEQCDDGGASMTCDSDCTVVECGDSRANPIAGEQCDGNDLGGSSCIAQGFDGGVIGCDGACMVDTSGCFTCGDGVADPLEPCDGADLQGETCTSQGYDGGILACDRSCMFDVTGCYVCGNGVIDPSEQCDGQALGGGSCLSEGFDDGILACGVDCSYDTSGCYICGDGVINLGEQCDDGGESPSCDIDCTPAECGDGVPNASAGEQCDDGNLIDNDACDNACNANSCQFVNGLLWCYNPSICGEPCNQVCASVGLVPVADQTAWFEAQNDPIECEALASAFGIVGTMMNSYAYACLEDSLGDHSLAPLLGPLFCSTDTQCPNSHLTMMDSSDTDCSSASSRRSICPCE